MISVPDTIKALFNTDGIRKNIRVSFPNGEHSDLTNADIEFESVSLTESLSSQPIIKFGLCESPCLEFTCHGIPNIKGMTIKVTIEIDVSSLSAEEIAEYGTTSDDVDFPYYSVPYGIYKVKKCVRSGDTDERKVVGYGKLSRSKNDITLTDELEYIRNGWRTQDTYTVTDKMVFSYKFPELADELCDDYSKHTSYWTTEEYTNKRYPSETIINKKWETTTNVFNMSHIVAGNKCITIIPCFSENNYSNTQGVAKGTFETGDVHGVYVSHFEYDDQQIDDIISSIINYGIIDNDILTTIKKLLSSIIYAKRFIYDRVVNDSHTASEQGLPLLNNYSYKQFRHNYNNNYERFVNNTLRYTGYTNLSYPYDPVFSMYVKENRDDYEKDKRYCRLVWKNMYFIDTDSAGYYNCHWNGECRADVRYITGFIVYIGNIGDLITDGERVYNGYNVNKVIETMTYSGNSVMILNRNVSKSVRVYYQNESNVFSETNLTNYFISDKQINELRDFLLNNGYEVIQSYLEIQGKFGMIDRTTGDLKVVDLTDHLMLYPSEEVFPAQDLYPRDLDAAVYRSEYRSIEYDDKPTKHYDRIECTWTDSNNVEHYQYYDIVDREAADYDPDDYQTYSLTDNYFIKNKYYTTTQIDEILQNLGEKIKDFQYFPCNIDMRGLPYLETGDGISVVTRDSGFSTFILRRVLSGINTLEDNIEAQ